MFKFEYRSPTDLHAPPLKVGEGDFKIISATPTTSKAGDPMLVVEMKAWDSEGNEGLLRDYILGTEKFAWKLYALCESVNMIDLYKQEGLNEEQLIGKGGRLSIKTEQGMDNRDYNKVDFYLPFTGTPSTAPDFKDDDVPF